MVIVLIYLKYLYFIYEQFNVYKQFNIWFVIRPTFI